MSCKPVKREAILKALKRGWVTSLDAVNECRTIKLTSRISDLRREGYEIEGEWVKTPTSKFKRYRLKEAA